MWRLEHSLQRVAMAHDDDEVDDLALPSPVAAKVSRPLFSGASQSCSSPSESPSPSPSPSRAPRSLTPETSQSVLAERGWSIRRARHRDVEGLAHIEAFGGGAGWTAEHFQAELGLVWSQVDILEGPASLDDADRLWGYMVFWIVADEVQLHNLATHPSRRRQGVGRALMLRLLERAREAGAIKVFLEVRRGNTPAQALYRAFGFVPTGVRKRYYIDNDEDAIVMELAIDNTP